MSVDLSPVLSTLIQLGALGLMAVGGVAIQRLTTKLGLDAHSALAARLDDALNKSIAAGAMAASGEIKARGWDHPSVKNVVIAESAKYLVAQWPALLQSVGINLAGPPAATRDAIVALLTRAFPTAMTPIAASPVTPSATVPASAPAAPAPPAVGA